MATKNLCKNLDNYKPLLKHSHSGSIMNYQVLLKAQTPHEAALHGLQNILVTP